MKKLLFLFIFTHFAPAADEIERVLVTADLQQRKLQQVDASVAVLDAMQLGRYGQQHLADVVDQMSNVTLVSGTTRPRFFQIRGIGERSQFTEPSNPSVALFLDGVDISGLGALAQTYDVQQVEVAKGPQAAAYGANALAGAIQFVTQQAVFNQEGQINLGIANQQTRSLGTVLNVSNDHDLAARITFNQYRDDGNMRNAYLQRNDTNHLDEQQLRAHLAWQIAPREQIDFRYYQTDINNGYDAFSLDNNGISQADEPGYDRTEADIISLSYQRPLGHGQLNLLAAQVQAEMAYGYDEDWTYPDFHPWSYSSFDLYLRTRQSDQVRIQYQTKDGLVVGFFGEQLHEDMTRQYTYAPADFSSAYQLDRSALYAQHTWQVAAQWQVNGQMRVSQVDLSYQDSTGFRDTLNDTLLGGKLAVQYQFALGQAYASLARGFKAGGVNPDLRVNENERVFQAEKNWHYEFGTKHLIAADWQMQVAMFYMQRQQTQVSDFAILEREDGSVEFLDIIKNADTGTNYGLELGLTQQVNPQLTMHYDLGLLSARYQGFTRSDGSRVEQQDQAMAPNYQYAIRADYLFNQDVELTLSLTGQDSYRFSDGHTERSQAYHLVNAELSYQYAQWLVRTWLKNALDSTYYTRGFGGFSNDPRDEYAFAEPYYQLADGRRFGINIEYQF